MIRKGTGDYRMRELGLEITTGAMALLVAEYTILRGIRFAGFRSSPLGI